MDKSGNVLNLLSGLNSEAETEAAKFGEDVKHLADVTNSNKKFDPWIAKSMEKAELIMDFFWLFSEWKVLQKNQLGWATISIINQTRTKSRISKRRGILFQISLLLSLTRREYFYSQPTHFSSQLNKVRT